MATWLTRLYAWLFRVHIHVHEAIAVSHPTLGMIAALASTTTAPTTYILFRCSCGDVRATVLAGRWTLAQIRGEEELFPLNPDTARPWAQHEAAEHDAIEAKAFAGRVAETSPEP